MNLIQEDYLTRMNSVGNNARKVGEKVAKFVLQKADKDLNGMIKKIRDMRKPGSDMNGYIAPSIIAYGLRTLCGTAGTLTVSDLCDSLDKVNSASHDTMNAHKKSPVVGHVFKLALHLRQLLVEGGAAFQPPHLRVYAPSSDTLEAMSAREVVDWLSAAGAKESGWVEVGPEVKDHLTGMMLKDLEGTADFDEVLSALAGGAGAGLAGRLLARKLGRVIADRIGIGPCRSVDDLRIWCAHLGEVVVRSGRVVAVVSGEVGRGDADIRLRGSATTLALRHNARLKVVARVLELRDCYVSGDGPGASEVVLCAARGFEARGATFHAVTATLVPPDDW